jgi:hypothetical protein
MPVPGTTEKEGSVRSITWGAGRRPALLVVRVVPFLFSLFVISAAPRPGTPTPTVQVTNQNDPAGDPTVVSYRLTPPSGAPPIDFALHDTESKGFGPFAGPVVVQALLPAGWRVEHIECRGFNLNGHATQANVFTIDEAHGTVTMQHAVDDEQFCTFTNGKASSDGGSSGVTPSPPANLGGSAPPPKKIALLAVKVKRGYAIATVHLIRRSMVTTRLRWHGRVIGRSRVVRKAGTYDFTVSIRPEVRRAFKRQGRKRVALELRVAVVEKRTKAKRAFHFRVLVPV